jgi:hypothetical protein
VSPQVKVGDENCTCLTNIIVKCNSPYSFPLSKLYFKHQQCKIKIKVLKNVIRTIDGSSMLELRRVDLQLFLIHYSFFVSVLYCYIWAILNLKSTPTMTPNSTPKKTPDSTSCFTTCLIFLIFHFPQIYFQLRGHL